MLKKPASVNRNLSLLIIDNDQTKELVYIIGLH